MQKQKHPSGQNQGYRYNGNNGTEGGGAGGGYPGAMRLCPQGPGQPGAQQQDPKQQAPQQAITGGMQVSYSQTPRGQNQYFPRHQRLNTPRLTGVGNMPMPNISYAVPGGQSVYPPVVSPIMMPQIPYQLSQPSGARHQAHAPAPTAPTGPPSGSFYPPQPPPQGATIFIPQHVPPTAAAAFYGQQLFALPAMRNSTYPPNSAPNQIPTQQAPPQQPQVVSGAGAANQGMMTLGMQPGGGPPPQVLAGAQQGAQLAGQPGPLVPGQPGAGGPPLVGPMPPHKDKRKRPKALPVTNPDTGIDVIAEMFMNEEAGGGLAGNAGQGRDADHHHHSQVAAEFAAKVAAAATEESIGMKVAPAVTETPPPPSQPAPVPSPAASTAIPTSEDIPNPSVVILSNGPQAPPPGTPPPITPSAPIVEQQPQQVLPPQPPTQHTVLNTPAQPPPPQAIPIVSAQTNSPAVDLHRPTTQHVVSVPSASSPARKPTQQQSTQHTQQMLQETVEVKSGKSKKDGRRPAPIATSPPPASVLTSQQYPPTSSATIGGNIVVQLPPVVPPAVQQQQQQQPSPQPSLAQPPVVQKEQQTATIAKREQIVSSSQPLPQIQPHKSSFADSIDVKNFVSQQQQQQQQKTSNVASSVSNNMATISSVEQKETNGETDVHETSTATSSTHSHSSSHTSSSHGPNSVGSKAQQRQKQSKLLKKKDLNRKGVEKEGTDMDAFVEHVTASPPTGAVTTAVSVAATVSTSTATATVTTVIQEMIPPTASSTTTSATISVPTSIISSQTQEPPTQQSPPLEKRLPVISPSSPKQAQDERDSSETISVPSTTSTPSATVESASTTTSISPTPVQITPAATPISDDSDSSSIEAMVAAKNQENTKVSALLNNNNINNNNNNNNNNNSSNIATTENNNSKSGDDDVQVSTTSSDSPQSGAGTVIETMTIERSHPPQLLYNYKEGQWSPLNTDGKKVYDRDFLLEVRKNPLSSRKPNNHIDPDVCRDKPHDAISSNNNNNNNNNRRNVHASNSMSLGNRGDNAVPTFMRSSQSQRGGGFSNTLQYSQMISSKGGRGTGGGGGGPRMGGGGGSMSGSMRDRDRMMKGAGSFGGPMTPYRGEEPQLHKTANSWKPSRNQDNKDKTDEELRTEKLLKAVRGILNKLTPQKFETLLNHILALPIDTNERLTRVVHLVFSKAVDEPSFSKEYAELCRRLSLNKMPQQQEQQGDQQQQQQHSASFRKLLLTKCQEEFEKNKTHELNIEARTKEIDECTDSEKKKELKLQLEEEERRIRIKKVGLVRFIGELYKLKMLTNKIMHGCITVLLDKIDEESLECLCKLLTTIGKELEQLSEKKEFDQYFQKMLKLSQKGPDPLVSSRIRFMLQDVIELRLKNWVPRRDENNPKTIEQIHKDAERETMLESALLSSQGSGGRSGGGGGGRHDSRDDRRGRQRGGGQSEDGWHPVGSSKNFTKNSYSVEPSKLQPFKEIDGSMSLGSSNQWGQWTTGAGTKKSSNPQVHVNNKFAALSRQDQDDRKPTMSSIMTRKGVTPSPSLEKDRAFAALKEVMLDSGRSGVGGSGGAGGGGGRAAGSGGSGPPSRESSRLRYGGGSLSGSNVSTSSSTGMPTGGNVSNQPSSVPTPTAAAVQTAPLMSEEEAERKTKTIIMEWLDNNNIQETVQTVQDTFVGVPNLVLFLRSALNLVLDHRKVIARPRTGYLMAVLVQENILPHQELIKEFAFVVEMGDDYKVDIPHVWKYIGELLGPVIAQEVFSFADLRSTADQVRPSKGFASALAEIIRILIKDKGPGWIRTQWESSRVQMKDFVPEEDVDKFIKENNLGFIMGEGEVQGVADASLTPVMVEEKILSFLYKDNDKVLDHIGDWLNANVGEKTKENDFIKALTRAVIKASLKGDKFSSSKLLKNEKLIKKFVDNDEGRELACLYSIQNLLVNELVQAPSVLLETFQTLYENGTISRDAFLRWKDPRQDEHICDVEHAGKGVALASLQSFFVSLSEQDDTDDETPS